MNIVHIIGNGFDLNLELKTKFTDFYSYYLNIGSKNTKINDIKGIISKDIESWADLESKLGEFTSYFIHSEDFDVFREDLIISLSDYLNIIEKSFDRAMINKDRLKHYLCAPHKELRNGDKLKIEEQFQNKKNITSKIDVISFNYTSFLDDFFSSASQSLNSVRGSLTDHVAFNSIKHIHGSINKQLILGVNDESQISNKNFLSNIDFVESFIKPIYNSSLNHLIDVECSKLIKKANIICVFGSSLGVTDKVWWHQIIQRLLSKECVLFIYYWSEEAKDQRLTSRENKVIRKVMTQFLSYAPDLTDNEIDLLKENIFIGVNTNYLKVV